MSAWSGESELHDFVRTDPHLNAMSRIRPLMDEPTFVSWTAPAASLPVTWDEARRRIEEQRATR